jgi:hypothetical protein
MTMVATGEWTRAQDALRDEVQRVTALLRSVRRPDAPSVGEWSLGDVAMHLSQAWIVVPGLARRDLSEVHELMPDVNDRPGPSLLSDVWELGGVTALGVRSDPERDLGVLADRIEERAAAFFALASGASALDRRPWLVEGIEVRLPTLTYHLLNETIVHGYDIAHADGRRWPIDRSHAASVIDGFLIPIIQRLDRRAMVDQDAAAGLRATYELHVRGGASHVWAFDDGALTIEAPSSRRIDCHLSADPADLLLVAWARKSQWSAIGRGKLVAWGRKPWLGPRFRGLMRNP